MIQTKPDLIQKIVIVGGGTAGWLSAAYLNRALNSNSIDRRFCEIVLIESSEINPVGVGEATVPSLPETFQFLGISESDWMIKCNATFKLGIKLIGWSGLDKEDIFWHPFGRWSFPRGDRSSLFHHWLKQKFQGHTESFDRSCFEAVQLCEAQKSPKLIDDSEYAWQVEYAYHLDAGLLATYLRDKAKSEGVKHIVDTVQDVQLDERGFINNLVTNSNNYIEGDLFIDCSGFRGLLINQVLEEPFVSFSDSLLCDRAVAIATPYDEGDPYNEKHGGLNPYTTATALSSGWSWNTPLIERSGNGYVYSSNFLSDEVAEAELRQHLGIDSKKQNARHLKMRVGRTRNPWVKNCVSIGLSSGFIEPLESTGIYLIEAGLEHLIQNFPNRHFQRRAIANYNRIIREHYEEIRDFIVMHYCLSKRRDTAFWQAVSSPTTIPPSLEKKLDLWQYQFSNNTKKQGWLFPEYSYSCILVGMGCLPKHSLPLLDYQSSKIGQYSLQTIAQEGKKLKASLPGQVEYLKQLRHSCVVGTKIDREDYIKSHIL